MLLEADALRVDSLITVILLGQFSTQCEEVEEIAHYPGTGIVPARIFLREERKPGLEDGRCPPGAGKIWSINRVIPDNYSKAVEIFINGQFVRRIRVTEFTIRGLYRINL